MKNSRHILFQQRVQLVRKTIDRSVMFSSASFETGYVNPY